MTVAENKTQASDASVDDFLSTIADDRRRADAQALRVTMERLSGEPAVMWGPAIIGFGVQHYKYDSGREGDICKIGFSPRKAATTLYLSADLDQHQELLDRLGKYSRGLSCLYLKRLDDADPAVLDELITTAWIAAA
jgi:hypothetical protein